MPAASKLVHADQRFIIALLKNDARVVREIYERFTGKVKRYILQHSGTEMEAADIFQDALIDIYRQAKHKKLELTCPFEPFLLLICKRKWLNELKKRKLKRVTIMPDELSIVNEDMIELAEHLLLEEEKEKLFITMYEKLDEKCREIIRRCLSSKPQEEIAAEMGLAYGYLRKKKAQCMATLIQSIKANFPIT